MIEMYVAGIALDARNGHPIVILNDSSKRRALPIWIGMAEANAITRALDNQKPERPMTHDLLLSLITDLGYSVQRIEINELSSSTYFANIVLKPLEIKLTEINPAEVKPKEAVTKSESKGKSKKIAKKLESTESENDLEKLIDARPSDAIALALRSKAPIMVSPQVIADGTIPADFEKDEEEAAEFRKFIDGLKASDFKIGDGGNQPENS